MCKTCEEDYIKHEMKCFEECPSDTWPNLYGIDLHIGCAKCGNNCKVCKSND